MKYRISLKSFIFAIILIISFSLIYIEIFDHKVNLGGDNINYYLLGKSISKGLGYVDIYTPELSTHTHFPPGYPFILSIVLFFNDSISLAKALNGVLLLGSLLISFILFKKLSKNFWVAAVSTCMLLFNYHLLEYSTIMMSEVAFIFSSFLAILVFVSLNDTQSTLTIKVLLTLALIAALAYYIRSFGIILIVSLLISLWYYRGKGSAGFFLGGVVLLVVPWVIRSRLVGGGGYVSQLLAANPYQPELGNASIIDFFWRVLENANRYIGKELPYLFFSSVDPGYQNSTAFKSYLIGLAIFGFIAFGLYTLQRYRVFFCIYLFGSFGVFLLWPSQWYGVRFIIVILPILIFLFFKGIFELFEIINNFSLKKRWFSKFQLVSLGIVLLFFDFGVVNALKNKANSDYPKSYQNFFKMAEWASENTADTSIFASRKPAFFYLFSKRKSIRFRDTPLEEQQILNLKYNSVDFIVLDNLGYSSAKNYLLPAIQKYPLKFSEITRFGEPPTLLLSFRSDLGYWGGWKNGKKHGKGTFKWPNGTIYDGHWEADKMHGEGVIKTPEGKRINGKWDKGVLIK